MLILSKPAYQIQYRLKSVSTDILYFYTELTLFRRNYQGSNDEYLNITAHLNYIYRRFAPAKDFNLKKGNQKQY